MTTINYNNSYVYFQEYKYENNKILKEFIDNKKYEFIIDKIWLDFNLVLGWDGTMLSALKYLMPNNLPFLWLNFWTKWFLLNDWIPNSNFDFKILSYPIFVIEICWKKHHCFNEFDIRSSDWKILTLDISINNCTWISISWDWIIVSTPLWSTGYNSSLWWPIIPHNLNAYVITPKAAWKPKWQQPILLNDKEVLTINNSWRINEFEIFSDGKSIFKSNIKNSFTIKKSLNNIWFIVFDDYIKNWDLKVFFEQWFKKKKPTL